MNYRGAVYVMLMRKSGVQSATMISTVNAASSKFFNYCFDRIVLPICHIEVRYLIFRRFKMGSVCF